MSTQPEDGDWVARILDALDVGVFRIDNANERIVQVNATGARILGFGAPEAAVGRSALEIYEDPKERCEVATRFASSVEFRRTGIARLEGRRVRVDTREPFDASIHVKAQIDGAGRVAILEGTIAKIGAPTAAEEAFRLGEQRFRVLFDATSMPMAIAQPDGALSRVNAALCRFLGRDEASLNGEKLEKFIHPDDRGSQAEERSFVRADGEIAWGQVTRSTINDENGNTSEVVIVQDTTERRRIEQNLLRVAKLESLGVLAGGIAHDFNNVLAVVLGTLTLAARQADAGPQTRMLLAEAEQAANRARGLARQLVTFAKGGTPVKRIGSLVPVIREAASFCARTVSTGVRFEEVFPDDLWLVELDSVQMNQVFHNLLLNAAQAMPRGGGVRVEAENVELAAASGMPLSPGRYLRVRVVDEGMGVDPKHVDRIFDPYFTTKSSGTGLGLAMAHSIVSRHGGHISVESSGHVPGAAPRVARHRHRS